MASTDVRVRVRESVIRVRVGETAIRAVIRITAPQDQLILLYLPPPPVGFRSEAVRVSEPRFVARHRYVNRDSSSERTEGFQFISKNKKVYLFRETSLIIP